MSNADDLILGANYYWILGLSDALDPVAENDKLRKIIIEREKEERAKIASAGSTNAETGARAALLLALHSRMLADLGAKDVKPREPNERWLRFRSEYQGALKAGRAIRQRDANVILDVLGESELSRRLADRVAAELDDIELFKNIVLTRKITIRNEGAPTDVPPGFETVCDKARRKAIKLLPYIKAYGAKDVYQLLSITTGTKLKKSSSEVELAAAIDILQQAPNQMTGDTKTKGKPLTEIKTELSDVFKVAQKKSDLESVRAVLDDLLLLESAMPFFATIRLLKSVDVLRRDQIERIVVKGAAASALPPDRVLQLLKGLMKKDNITIGNWGLTGHFRVCAACGTTNLGTDYNCASCRTDLYSVCANCDTRFDGTASECPTCGTSKVEGEAGRVALAQSMIAIERGDIVQAEHAIGKAMRHVPRSQAFTGLNAKLDDLKSRAGLEEIRLTALVRDERRMVAAAQALGRTPLGFSAAVRDRLKEAVDRALSEATKKVADAQAKLGAKNPAEAERQVRAALALAADFTPALSLLERIPPPPPRSLSVQPKGATATLSWAAPDTAGDGMAYVVVRSEVGPPSRPVDAEVITKTTDRSFIDTTPTCGITFSYAVFSQRGATISEEAARMDNVCILAPVEKFEARSDEHSIRLSWCLPKGARYAEIRRLPPETHATKVAAAPILAHAPESYTDVSASEGCEYRYYVTPCYGVAGSTDRRGPTVSTLASISAPPSPVSILRIDRSRGQVHWNPPPRPGEDDEILLLSLDTRIPDQNSLVVRGDMKVSAIASVGTQGAIPLDKIPFGRHLLLAIRTRNGITRIGPRLAFDQITPLKNAALAMTETGCQVSWTWPAGCKLASLKVTIDHLAPQEFLIEAEDAASTASKFIAAKPPSQISIRLAALIDRSGPESEPITRQCQLVRKNELRYDLTVLGSGVLRLRGKKIVVAVELKHPEPLPEFEIRFHPDYIPGPGEGECLRIVTAGKSIVDRHEEDVSSVLGNRQGFVGVIVTDVEIRSRMTIVPVSPRI